MTKVAAVFESDLALQQALDAISGRSISADVQVLTAPEPEQSGGQDAPPAASRPLTLVAVVDRFPELETFPDEQQRYLTQVLQHGGELLIADIDSDQSDHFRAVVDECGGRLVGHDD